MIVFDSDEEKYFSWALDELVEEGWVGSYEYQPESFELSAPLKHTYIKETVLKTKTKTELKEQIILKSSSYTTDFKIIWNEKSNSIFYQILEESSGIPIQAPFIAHREGSEVYSWIEVKPQFDQNNMTREFIIKQKSLWEKDKVFINLCIVPRIFEQTFTPEKYKLTSTGKQKKIKFNIKTLEKFINEKTF